MNKIYGHKLLRGILIKKFAGIIAVRSQKLIRVKAGN